MDETSFYEVLGVSTDATETQARCFANTDAAGALWSLLSAFSVNHGLETRDLWKPCLQIRRAYRNLLTKTHPDKGGDTEQFDRVKAAYEVLADVGKVMSVQGLLSSTPRQSVFDGVLHFAERNL